MSGQEVVPDLLPRLEQLARETRDAQDAAQLLQRQRDALIVEAVDAGITQRAVAQAAGISKGRIIAVLANAPITEEV